MSLLSAIFSGRSGFVQSTSLIAQRADRIANAFHEPEGEQQASDDQLTKDLVGIKTDSLQAKASLRVFSLSDSLLRELTKIGK